MLKSLVGDKAFYKSVFALTLPIMVQNGITHLVSMLDNIMVGSLGDAAINGVTIANQLIFVFSLCIFGAVSGAGIFGAQFAGNRDVEGITYTMRFKLLFCTGLAVAAIGVFLLWGDPLILLYLQGKGNATVAAESLEIARDYLNIMLVGLVPFTLSQCYGSTLRETGQTTLPMVAGIIAVAVNLVGNAFLIFGLCGAPRLETDGAAIATVVSRFVELGVLVAWTHTHPDRNPFVKKLYHSMRIPLRLVGQIFVRGLPLMANEAAWSVGMATLNQQYTLRSLNMVTANSICQTFWNVFSVSFMALGIAVGIILGQKLGAGDQDGAREDSRKLIALSVLISIGAAALFALAAPFIPYIFKATLSARQLATTLILVAACAMPIDAFAHSTYFTLRSGGQAFITFLFDSCFMWAVNVPLAFLLVHYTTLPVVAVFAACQFINIIKCILGGWLVHKGGWIKTIVQ